MHLVFIPEVQGVMPGLTIPERYRSGVAALAALPEESFVQLFEALKNEVTGDTSDSLASQLGLNLPSIPYSDLSKIIAAIASMQSVESRSHVSTDTFVSDIWEAFIADAPDLAVGIDEETLKSRVSQVVTGKTINLTSAKIMELKTEVERSFCRARILTDVRMAFSDDANEAPRGMAILHNLQIAYHDDRGRHREFYVTLEDDDLIALKEAVERAEKKKKALEELLAKADCRFFE